MKRDCFKTIVAGAVVSIVMMTSSISASCTDYSTSEELNEQFEDFNRDIATQGVTVDRTTSTVDPKQAFPTGNSATTSQTVTDDAGQAQSEGSALTSSDAQKKSEDASQEKSTDAQSEQAAQDATQALKEESAQSDDAPESTKAEESIETAQTQLAETAQSPQLAETAQTPQPAETAQPAQGKYQVTGLVVALAVIAIMLACSIAVRIRKRK